ncbi:MAG TPA: heavy metal sensor histidine kinase [Holophagaceae bacterium]|jgi:two-component system heavy metal sensor histidine kinase CusS|nr:heavy metal sensor histidine kinase [Holophagaceae bacterium]
MHRSKRPSLVARLALAYGLVALLLMGASSMFLYRSLAHAAWRDDAEDVHHASRTVAQRLDAEGEADSDALDVEEGVLVRVRDASGRTVVESPGMAALPAPLFPGPSGKLAKLKAPDGSRWIATATAWKGGTVEAAKDLGHHARLLDSYKDTLVANALLVALLAALAGWLIARRGLAPLGRLAEATAGIHPGTLDTRLDPEAAPAELERLVIALNGALARLEEAFSRLAALSADMAHELRTPLHALRLELESLTASEASPALRDRMGAATESVDHMGALIEQMLFLARAEDPATVLDRQDLDLGQALRDAARPFEILADEKGLALRVEADRGTRIHADATLLRRAIHNLIANAVRHTAAGGVTLRGSASDGFTEIEVRDTGEGIAPDQLPRLGRRFARADASRSRATGGTGLGLAIVESILRLHGGSLVLESEPGKGATAKMRFPRT